jgi:DNA mismatch repair protein MutS2
MTPAPDLLHQEPRGALPGAELRQALTFAFTTGGTQAAFDHLAADHEDVDRSWSETCFAEQLLLRDFVERLLPLPHDVGRVPHRPARAALLVAVLGRPPRSPGSLRQRQEILEELARRPEIRAAAVAAYRKIADWRALLEASASGQRFDPLRRRIEILYATEALMNELATGLADATSELRRVARWAEAVRASPAFRTLSQLLADETSLATVDVSMRLGRDGELRRYQLVRVEEPRTNPFHVSPWQRLWSRLVLLVLGHRIRTDEVASRLVDGVFEALEPELCRVFDLARDLDLVLGALSLRDRALAAGLPVCLPELTRAEGRVSLCRLYNPFLLFEERPPVPCDLALAEAERIVIVTGPNSGGKTRLLEAIGLTQILAHGGLWVPAETASLPFAHGLFASLFQPRDVTSREGSLGTELLRIKSIFERIDVGGLVVVDELCSGTNPSEGEEIFEVVVELLGALRARAFITSHFLHFVARLAREAQAPGGLGFRQVELDGSERPTYQFAPGVAKTSLAGRTAARLGVTREELSAVVAAKLARAAGAGSAPSRGAAGSGLRASGATAEEHPGGGAAAPGPDLDARAGSS